MRLDLIFYQFLLYGVLILFMPVRTQAQDCGIRFPDNGAPWCLITRVVPGSFADSIGVLENDIILSINGVTIHNADELRSQRDAVTKSDIDMIIWRDGRKITLKGHFPGGGFGIYPVYVNRGITLSVDDMKEDLDSLFSFIYEAHPNPYASFPENEFRAGKERLYASLEHNMTEVEFWKSVARFVAKIQDGHTGLRIPAGDWHYRRLSGEPIIFPFEVLITTQGVYITRNLSQAPISPGYEILAINEHSIDSLLLYLEQFMSGELRHFRYSQIERNFQQLVYQLAGIEPPFHITLRSVDGTVTTYTIDGIDRCTMEKHISTTPGLVTDFTELPDIGTAVIRFNMFTDQLPDFFRSSFSTIQEKNYRHVIIDLQHNGGGNSAFADTLMSYLTDKPYRFFGGAHIKISRFVLSQSPAFGSNEIGTVVEFPGSTPTRPPGRHTRFAGNIYCLISNRTFSTASGFAAVLKDFGIGTLVGEETGGLPTTYGDVASATLPHSSFGVGASMKFFIRPNGDLSYVLEGVQPDIEVPVTGLDILKGRDPVLEAVQQIIDKKLH
jgi:C-terminal processing protease CtpA/Prc